MTDADRHQLRGPRGWLTVFRLALLVVAPFDVAAGTANVLANARDFSTGDWLRVMPEILLDAGPALYGVFVAALLAHERPEVVQHARQYLVVSVLCFAGLVLKVGLFDGARYAVDLMPYLLGALIGAYIWMRYFRLSRRVLVTYSPDALSSKVSVPTLALVTMAVALLVFVPLATLRAFWPSAVHGWTLYAPATGGFRLELPGTPELSDESFTEADGTVSILSTALVETWDGMASLSLTKNCPTMPI